MAGGGAVKSVRLLHAVAASSSCGIAWMYAGCPGCIHGKQLVLDVFIKDTFICVLFP